MRKGAVAIAPSVEQLLSQLGVENFVGDAPAAEHRLQEGRDMVGCERGPAHTSAPEKHVTALVHSGHAHDEASADLADEPEVRIKTRGSGAATADAIIRALGTQKAFVDRISRELDVGFLWILLLKHGSWRLHIHEWLLA